MCASTIAETTYSWSGRVVTGECLASEGSRRLDSLRYLAGSMSEFIYKERTERNLPHFHPPSATLFVTFRLAGTVPKSVLQLYYAKKKWFQEETQRIAGLKVRDDSPELQTHTKK